MPPGKKIKIVDGREKTSWGSPLKVSRAGDYDPEVIRQISTAAVRQGIDPYTALAVGLQESGLGTYKTLNADSNWGQVNLDKWGNDPGVLAELDKNKDLAPHAVAMNYILKKYMSESKDADEAKRIQGYNGYLLKANNDIGAKTMYGIDLTKYPKGYDLKSDPRYGNAVIDLRENVLKKSPDVVSYVNSLQQPATAQDNQQQPQPQLSRQEILDKIRNVLNRN